ncbi:MAG: hypothetical protein LC737_07665 [Chloroflexi bacterium]|nr:hypothetical protein [Chloroflexota bacterium]
MQSQTWKRIVTAVSVVVLGAPTLMDSIRFDYLLTQTDTRSQARAWIASNLPRGTSIALDWFPFAPVLPSERYTLLSANGWSLADLTLDDYRARGVEYLLTSSYVSEQRRLDSASEAQRQSFYAALTQHAEPVVEFRPYVGSDAPAFVYDEIYAPFVYLDRLTRPGPTIVIYRLSVHETIR